MLQAVYLSPIELHQTPDWSDRPYNIHRDPLWKTEKQGKEFDDVWFYHCDHLGTPQEMTDHTGAIVWKAQYKAWGECKVKPAKSDFFENSETISNNIRFQGQYFDQETGLYYNRYRYYSPYVGRFISKNPIGLLGGYNLYRYVDNPIAWIDPFGLRKKRGRDAPRHEPSSVEKVNNRMPINSCFAGKTMMSKDLPAPVRGNYPNGVPFNMKGFPDFSRYAKTTVNIGSFTKDSVDFRSANAKIGLSGSQAPDGFVWHHTDKNGVLQLIPRDIHDAVRHTGGAAICGISNRGLYGI